METIASLVTILAVLIVGVISPGPSFLLVAQTAVSQSRKAAVFSAFGMALGATILCIFVLLGLQAVLQQFPRAYLAIKLAGAAYLVYLAIKLWLAASKTVALDADAVVPRTPYRHFTVALGVMLTNPKAAIQYGVLFGTFIPANPPLGLVLILPICVFTMEAGWYCFVAYALSSQRSKLSYLSAKRYIDRFASVLLGGMGIRLLLIK
ncbi:LysE family translocator [Curvibacter sp. CHRR-16]|uniref:LysE family translocator n=1 Tax=Curvibacter sp. CHRR-16 TaxID=2835872 RepID=UPI001BDA259B|nr:LysE family translocator [Curvibacter sp. CHRR-16]MBT0570829.1 LysE family translocator [Curvibacter sp. CHRR-16]